VAKAALSVEDPLTCARVRPMVATAAPPVHSRRIAVGAGAGGERRTADKGEKPSGGVS
jgi:hypothetical protein